jgi:hypothetical protein
LVQRISSWFIVIAAFGMILTGLNGYTYFAQLFEGVVPFAPHRVFDVLLITAIIIHVVIGIRFVLMRRRVNTRVARRITLGIMLIFMVITFTINAPAFNSNPIDDLGDDDTGDDDDADDIYVPPSHIKVDGRNVKFTEHKDVVTVRPDIFRPGSFSVFDVLVHLDGLGRLDLEYHFNESMNTFVIDSLNNISHWWYRVEYSGGWPEGNAYRMDHYLWKPGTWLTLYPWFEDRNERRYATFVDEVERLRENNGTVILPHIEINTPRENLIFKDIIVTPHNLRNETFQDGVITAIDVITTLGDLGLIQYDLQWYDRIGTAQVVRSYWVERINKDQASGTCGFVYDTGSYEFYGFSGNHIHLPSDVNVLNSPEYMRWFWICI